jgi:hypothetical protein
VAVKAADDRHTDGLLTLRMCSRYSRTARKALGPRENTSAPRRSFCVPKHEHFLQRLLFGDNLSSKANRAQSPRRRCPKPAQSSTFSESGEGATTNGFLRGSPDTCLYVQKKAFLAAVFAVRAAARRAGHQALYPRRASDKFSVCPRHPSGPA